MKKYIYITVLFILCSSTAINAKVWRVNNHPQVDADFTTLQTAIDSASWGDTLYIEASPTNYGNGTFNKKLIVIGAGYWHAQNDSLQDYQEESWVKQLAFNEGSEGSEISGLYVYYGDFGSSQNWKLIAINTDSISIMRNYIYGYASGNSTYAGFSVFLSDSVSGVVVQQNWINTVIYDTYGSSNGDGTVRGIYISGIPINTIIRNNLIRSYRTGSRGSYRSIDFTSYDQNCDLIINNNVLWGSLYATHSLLVNNILVEGGFSNGSGNQTANNLCSETQFPDVNNNQQNVVMDSVFVDYDKYIDNGYFLKPNSPAKNAGINGGDCGVFSYDYQCEPYVLSGLPAIPSIFKATYTTVGTTELPVNIKARSNK
jgi:hypothetical protein